jgi:hypothetical protein
MRLNVDRPCLKYEKRERVEENKGKTEDCESGKVRDSFAVLRRWSRAEAMGERGGEE